MIRTVCFLLILFLSCKQNKNFEVSINKKYLLADSSANTGNVKSVIYSTKEDEYLFIYDSYFQIIRMFSLQQNKLIKIIPVSGVFTQKEYNQVNELFVENFDSIFLSNRYFLKIIDTSSKTKYQFVWRNPNTDTFPKTSYSSFDTEFNSYYNANTHKIFLRQYKGDVFRSDSTFYTYPIECSFSLNNNSFEVLNENYPQNYLKGYYGELYNCYRAASKENHVLSFNIDPNLYVYDLITKQTKIKNCQSSFQKSLPQTMPLNFADDINRRTEHLLQNPIYLDILYDKYRDCYYRFFYNAMTLQKPDGSYNNLNDKQKVLMIIDKDFNVIKEIELPRRSKLINSFVAKEGLYIYQYDNIEKKITDSILKITNSTNEKSKIFWYNIYTPVFN